jgi:uncharacterized membrane protein
METATKIFRVLAIAFVVAWFLFGGVTHFTNAEFFLTMMPPYLPFHLEIVWISGAFEVLGAIGLLLARTRLAAGIGLIVLTIAVTPANVYMAMNPDLFPDANVTALYGRLAFQVFFLWLIWFSTGGVRAARRGEGGLVTGNQVKPELLDR